MVLLFPNFKGTSQWSDWLGIASAWYNQVWAFLKSIFSSVGQIIVGIVQWIGRSEIIKDVFRAIQWVLGQVFDVVGWIGEKLLWLWENVLEPILDGIDSAYKTIKSWITDEEGKSVTIKTDVMPLDDNNLPKPPSATPNYQTDLTRFSNVGAGGTVADIGAKKVKNRASERKVGETISGGGPKTINIHLGKFFDTIQFTTMNGNESAQQLENIVLECLGRVLYNGAKTV